jgi:hypothetical protein
LTVIAGKAIQLSEISEKTMTGYRIWLTLGLSLFAALTMPNSAAVAQRRARPSVSPLALEPCRLPGWNEDVRCAKYEVYEDREAKTGRRITLKVVVLPATGARKPDPVFYALPDGLSLPKLVWFRVGRLCCLAFEM